MSPTEINVSRSHISVHSSTWLRLVLVLVSEGLNSIGRLSWHTVVVERFMYSMSRLFVVCYARCTGSGFWDLDEMHITCNKYAYSRILYSLFVKWRSNYNPQTYTVPVYVDLRYSHRIACSENCLSSKYYIVKSHDIQQLPTQPTYPATSQTTN